MVTRLPAVFNTCQRQNWSIKFQKKTHLRQSEIAEFPVSCCQLKDYHFLHKKNIYVLLHLHNNKINIRGGLFCKSKYLKNIFQYDFFHNPFNTFYFLFLFTKGRKASHNNLSSKPYSLHVLFEPPWNPCPNVLKFPIIKDKNIFF